MCRPSSTPQGRENAHARFTVLVHMKIGADTDDLDPQTAGRARSADANSAGESVVRARATKNAQVKERRRLARHPARAIPEPVATAPGQVFSWNIELAGPIKGRLLRDDRDLPPLDRRRLRPHLGIGGPRDRDDDPHLHQPAGWSMLNLVLRQRGERLLSP